MKIVTKIDKIQNVTNQKQKLRVAAYCRVSTSNDAQLESLETQKAWTSVPLPEWSGAGEPQPLPWLHER